MKAYDFFERLEEAADAAQRATFTWNGHIEPDGVMGDILLRMGYSKNLVAAFIMAAQVLGEDLTLCPPESES